MVILGVGSDPRGLNFSAGDVGLPAPLVLAPDFSCSKPKHHPFSLIAKAVEVSKGDLEGVRACS